MAGKKEDQRQKNRQRVLKFMSKRYGEDLTEKQLSIALTLIKKEHKDIFQARWGMFDGDYCWKFQQLDKKLGRKNSRLEYSIALKKLEGMLEDLRHVEIFQKCENLEPESSGELWRVIFAEPEVETPIEEIKFSRVTYCCLKRSGIDTVEDFMRVSKNELVEIFGSEKRIKESLRMQKKLAK